MKRCISCGMPMVNKEDYACGDINKDYCSYCEGEDGSLMSFDDTVERMTEFMARSEGIDKYSAERKALQYMKTMPAWKENFK